jgi:dihydrofolate synthase/folylpolyglutamate synthase
MPDDAVDVIAQVCRERGARLVDASRHALTAAPGLEGAHQQANAAVAVCLLNELRALGIAIPDAAIQAGVTGVKWPGRLEHFEWRGAHVLIDAAHNPAGARALARYLDDTGWVGIAIVLGLMRDKDATGMLEALLPHASTVVCTTPPNPRAMPAAELAALAASLAPAGVHVSSIDDPAAALAAASRHAARVVAAGSIFLIGPLRGILR